MAVAGPPPPPPPRPPPPAIASAVLPATPIWAADGVTAEGAGLCAMGDGVGVDVAPTPAARGVGDPPGCTDSVHPPRTGAKPCERAAPAVAAGATVSAAARMAGGGGGALEPRLTSGLGSRAAALPRAAGPAPKWLSAMRASSPVDAAPLADARAARVPPASTASLLPMAADGTWAMHRAGA